MMNKELWVKGYELVYVKRYPFFHLLCFILPLRLRGKKHLIVKSKDRPEESERCSSQSSHEKMNPRFINCAKRLSSYKDVVPVLPEYYQSM